MKEGEKMTEEQLYATKIAINARKACVEVRIIDDNVKKLDFETLQKIVNFFGGQLLKDDKINSYYKCKLNESQFDICIGNDINEEMNQLQF